MVQLSGAGQSPNGQNDLVSYWRAEDNACDAADGNHGTPKNGAGFAAGKVGQGFSFDGVNDYVTVPDDTSLRLGKNQTIKAWYKWAGGGTDDWRRLVGKGAASPRNYGLWIHPQTNRVLFQIYNQGATVGCNAILSVASDSNWHQLAGTYDGSRIKLYYDGGLVSDVACTLTPAITADPLTIGFANAGVAPFHSPFDGLIDEVKVYNTAHTAAEIAAQYNKENNGPVSLWPAEGNADDLIDGNDGTLVNGTGFAAGIFGQGFDFDGADDYVTFGTGPVITGKGPFAVEAWVATTDPEGVIIQQRSAAVFNGEYVLSIDGMFLAGNPGRVCWATYGNDLFGFNFCSTKTVNDGAFHHIAGVREADGTGRIYIDGVLDSSQSAPPRTLVTIDVYLGKDVRDGIRALDGQIDEVSIWNRALTACEVAVNALVPCDDTPPVVTVPADITEEATSGAGASVTFSPLPSANDIVDGAITPFCTSSSGDTFPLGTTTVNCSATDAAGNLGQASFDVTVEDTTPPNTTTSSSPGPNGNGWNKTNVTVSFAATDGGSGVKEISYTVDAGSPVITPGASANTVLSSEGTHNVSYYATDNAGNSSAAKSVTVRIDKTDPLISSSRSVGPNANDWNKTSVTVSYTASDALSGIDLGASATGDDVLSLEGAGQSATGTVVDEAGNSASATESPINIDLTDPLISSSRSVAPNANDWNNTGVTVSYTASDALSGIDLGASATGDDVLSSEGAGQSATGTVVDEAGNEASATESPINIDLTDPLISSSRSIGPNANDWNKTSVTVSYTASDALSGIDVGASATGDDVLSSEGAGQSATGTVVDEAGNEASATESPINIDLTDPILSLPPSVTLEATSPAGADHSYSATASDNFDPAPSVSCAPASPNAFPVGTALPGETVVTTVNCTATDQADRTDSGSFTVTVEDTTPPALVVPAPITVECNTTGGVPTNDPQIQAWLASASPLTSWTPIPASPTMPPASATWVPLRLPSLPRTRLGIARALAPP